MQFLIYFLAECWSVTFFVSWYSLEFGIHRTRRMFFSKRDFKNWIIGKMVQVGVSSALVLANAVYAVQ